MKTSQIAVVYLHRTALTRNQFPFTTIKSYITLKSEITIIILFIFSIIMAQSTIMFINSLKVVYRVISVKFSFGLALIRDKEKGGDSGGMFSVSGNHRFRIISHAACIGLYEKTCI